MNARIQAVPQTQATAIAPSNALLAINKVPPQRPPPGEQHHLRTDHQLRRSKTTRPSTGVPSVIAGPRHTQRSLTLDPQQRTLVKTTETLVLASAATTTIETPLRVAPMDPKTHRQISASFQDPSVWLCDLTANTASHHDIMTIDSPLNDFFAQHIGFNKVFILPLLLSYFYGLFLLHTPLPTMIHILACLYNCLHLLPAPTLWTALGFACHRQAQTSRLESSS